MTTTTTLTHPQSMMIDWLNKPVRRYSVRLQNKQSTSSSSSGSQANSLSFPTTSNHHHFNFNFNLTTISNPIKPGSSQQAKRSLALPPPHHIRSKRIKLNHSFFRSPQLLYPIDEQKTIETPRWLHTSAAAQGQPTRMAPQESQWSGNPDSWKNKPRPTSKPITITKTTKTTNTNTNTLKTKTKTNTNPPGPQLAPLKAQLMAVLRIQSNHQPAQAALRLKKWVIWNAWVRDCAQIKSYPIANPKPSNITRVILPSTSPILITTQTEHQPKNQHQELKPNNYLLKQPSTNITKPSKLIKLNLHTPLLPTQPPSTPSINYYASPKHLSPS